MAEAFDYFNEIWVTEWEETASDASDPPHKLLTLLRLGAFEFEAWREVQWRIWVEFWSLGDRDPKFRDSTSASTLASAVPSWGRSGRASQRTSSRLTRRRTLEID